MSNSTLVSGVLDEIQSRNVAGRVMYDLVVDGVKYGNGPFKVTEAQGTRVQFEVEQRGAFKNVKRGSLKPFTPKDFEEESKQVVAPDPSPSNFRRPMSKDDYWRNKELRDLDKEQKYELREKEKQLSISFEAARSRAIEYVAMLAQADALYLKASLKAGEKQEYIAALVNDLTRKFFRESTHRQDFIGKNPIFDEDLSIETEDATTTEIEDKEWD